MLLVLCCAASALAAPSALEKECNAARGKKPATKVDRLAVRLTKSSEPIRSVVLRRFVQCGYHENKFQRAIESIYLQVATQDRGEVQFDTKNPTQTKQYYVECEGAIRTTLQDLATKGFTASIPQSFTLPCVHRIYRKDGGEADRVTGINTFKPKQGSFEVLSSKGTTLAFRFDATVENQFERLRLEGEASGKISNSVQVFNCGDQGNTKRAVPAPCR